MTASTNGNPSETYTFDAAGNLTSIGPGTSLTYQKNRLQTMTQGGQTTYFFFDAAKRWRTVEAPTNSQTDLDRTTFTYTGTGRLATWTKYTGGSASTTATYTYDASGQRTRSVVAAGGGLTTTTDFVYEGLLLQSLSATQVGTGATSWRITYLYDERGKPYAGLYRSPASSTSPVLFALVTTDRGDVVSLLDAAGNPFAAYRYDAWGNPQGSGNVAIGIWSQSTNLISSQLATEIASRQVLRYASYCYDPESGLYYLSARSYDPQTRQFLSKDLSRSDGEQSAYQYCGGNPVRYTDPTGFYSEADELRYSRSYLNAKRALSSATPRTPPWLVTLRREAYARAQELLNQNSAEYARRRLIKRNNAVAHAKALGVVVEPAPKTTPARTTTTFEGQIPPPSPTVRERMIEALDLVSTLCPSVWISGPAGVGAVILDATGGATPREIYVRGLTMSPDLLALRAEMGSELRMTPHGWRLVRSTGGDLLGLVGSELELLSRMRPYLATHSWPTETATGTTTTTVAVTAMTIFQAP